ncbi:MAG: hypothetical protein N3B21_02090 [Clostridia bacterium]|nr:hypothetical protein [Clostridia bacterium]
MRFLKIVPVIIAIIVSSMCLNVYAANSLTYKKSVNFNENTGLDGFKKVGRYLVHIEYLPAWEGKIIKYIDAKTLEVVLTTHSIKDPILSEKEVTVFLKGSGNNEEEYDTYIIDVATGKRVFIDESKLQRAEYGKYYTYIERLPDNQGVIVKYTDKTTSKVIFTAKSEKEPICSEKYVVIYTKGAANDSKLYDRYVININTGNKELLDSKVQDENCHGIVSDSSTFILQDAIYNFEKKVYIRNIKVLTSSDTSGSIKISENGKTYLLNPVTLNKMEYPGLALKDTAKVFLESGIYGVVYVYDGTIYWQKASGAMVNLGPFEPLPIDTWYSSEYGFKYDPSREIMSILNSPKSCIVLNLKEGSYKKYELGYQYTGISFKPSSKEVGYFYKDACMAQQQWYTGLTVLDKNKKTLCISSDAINITYHKNWLVFSSDIQTAGHMDIWGNSVSVYNYDTGKKSTIRGYISNYNIVDGKVYAEVTNSNWKTSYYVFDDKKFDWVPYSFKTKYLGYGVYMKETPFMVYFIDKSGKDISHFSRYNNQEYAVCAILPGYTRGFVYDGKKLISVTLPDVKRYTKSYEIKICDNYLMYYYPGKDAKTPYVRILKYK